jgi:hypothetical protein
MRSRFEAEYARWLDQMGFDWAYEPMGFAGLRGSYLPDFGLKLWVLGEPRPRRAYVETKPAEWPYFYDAENDIVDYERLAGCAKLYGRMAAIWESEPNALLLHESPSDEWDPMDVGLLEPDTSLGVWTCRENTWTWAWRTDWRAGQPPVLARHADLGERAIALPRSAGPWPDRIPKLV